MASTFHFRPAVRENVGLFIGIAGEQGSGKTRTAMRLAKGIVGPGNRFAVIDTENRRSLHYADDFDFDVLELAAPYSSERYEQAVQAAIDAGYKAVVLDSASHEHDGIGGYLETQEADLNEMVKRSMERRQNANEYEVRQQLTPLSWQGAKKARRRMMQTLLNCSASVPVIWCFRAQEKSFGTKDGKLVAYNPRVWAPICGASMPYEMTVFLLMHQDRPGVIAEALKLQEQHKPFFPMGQQLTEAAGEAIARWAKGRVQAEPEKTTAGPSTQAGGPYITPDQVIHLGDRCREAGTTAAKLLEKVEAKSLETIPADAYDRALTWLARLEEARRARA